MNLRQKGFYRDKAILAEIEEVGALNTRQIYRLFFRGLKYGEKKAQARMRVLFQRKKVLRCRVDVHEPFCYYRGKKPGLMEHTILLNWAYIYLFEALANWERLVKFQREYVCGELRADAIAEVYKSTGEWRFIFIEIDRASSRNEFMKVEEYNELYENEHYIKSDWYERAKVFPEIWLFTTTDRKKESIERRVSEDNRNGLKFKVIKIKEE